VVYPYPCPCPFQTKNVAWSLNLVPGENLVHVDIFPVGVRHIEVEEEKEMLNETLAVELVVPYLAIV